MTSTAIFRSRDSVRWGIIGCGDVTEVKSGPGFQEATGSQLVAVMRRNAGLADDYARRHGVPKWYADAEALILDPEVDAVYVATPPGAHCEYALKICAAGKPAYIEKPMARNATECERMVKAFAAAKLPLFVAYYRRALPRFLKAKELIETGEIGQLTQVTYQYTTPPDPTLNQNDLPWRLKAEESGGGLFLDLGSHALDILDFLLGPLTVVLGWAWNVKSSYDVEDAVAMSCHTEKRVPVTAAWHFAAADREDKIEIHGETGCLSLSTFGPEPVRLETDNGVQQFDLPNPPHVAQPLIQTVVNDLRGCGTCPSTGESALRTARVMDAALDAYYSGRNDEFWLRPESWPGRARLGPPKGVG
ncbi:MAG TPA: Gfo/Idh/MocA family oxidoreductase [Verrucomicrobiae bacterium]|nr:Gfo/Idh/MocA family oxidoreductase [Verrucomicrobiae bacterium]